MRIKQILFNFIDNAIKFTHEGYVKLVMNYVNIDECNHTLDLEIKIIDTGEGIPEDQQTVIFEPYIQKKGQYVHKYKGTGLGLSISKKLIDLMGGEIFVQSKINSGTTFTLLFKNIPFENS